MGAVAPKENGRKAPIKIPSFVFRQDGCELSYEVGVIIREKFVFVKGNPGYRKEGFRILLFSQNVLELFQGFFLNAGYITAADVKNFGNFALPLGSSTP